MRILAGKWGGRSLSTIEGEGYRPAMSKVREALFSMLEARGIIWSGLNVLDLYAGSGSLAFEAASRGAEKIYLVEKLPKAVSCLKRNAEALGIGFDACRIVAADTNVFLRNFAKDYKKNGFGLVFIDPPYKHKLIAATIKNIMRHNLLMPEAMLVIEVENNMPINPENVHEDLQPIADRAYGQTRIIIWKVINNAKQCTQEHLIP